MTINALKMQNLRPRNRTGGDCVVLALTFLTGSSYSDVEDLIKEHHSRYMSPTGTRARGVFTEDVLRDRFDIFGYRLIKVEQPITHRIYSFARANPTGTYLLRINHHALVIHNGQQFDACDSSINSPVLGVWKAEKVVA